MVKPTALFCMLSPARHTQTRLHYLNTIYGVQTKFKGRIFFFFLMLHVGFGGVNTLEVEREKKKYYNPIASPRREKSCETYKLRKNYEFTVCARSRPTWIFQQVLRRATSVFTRPEYSLHPAKEAQSACNETPSDHVFRTGSEHSKFLWS